MSDMTPIQKFLLDRNTPTYNAYYNGKMSYALHGKEWEKYVTEAFEDITNQQTSENIFKDVIDLYVSNLIPSPKELKGFSNTLVPLLSRGEAPVLVDHTGAAHFPEHYELVSDGLYTVAAIFTRSLEYMEDYVTFVSGDGVAELWSKPVPSNMEPADRNDYKFVETQTGNTLYRFALDDKGMGGSLAALQDRANHSIIDQTVVAEMYARPFWYLLNVSLPPKNPYLPDHAQPEDESMREQRSDGAAGRIFTTSGEGPFGQLTPPTIGDMVSYHDSIISKVSQSTGIPEFFFKPGSASVPSGTALKVLSRRFNNKVGRIRENLETNLMELVEQLGIQPEEDQDEVVLWDSSDDLLQESLDTHGLALSQMGYPLDYVAEVVTPGVDLDDYLDDGFDESQMSLDQIQAYASNPGQAKGQQQMPSRPNVSPDHPSNGSNLRPVE